MSDPAAILRFKARYGQIPNDEQELLAFLAQERAQSITIQDLPAPPAARPVAAKLPWAARIALGAKVPRPLIWKADIKRWQRKQRDYNQELAAIRDAGLKAANSRGKGDPLAGTLTAVWNQLFRLGRYTAGMVHASYKQLKDETGWSVDVVFEVMRFFEAADVLKVLNTRDRGTDRNGKPGVFNAANIYVLQLPEGAAPEPSVEPHKVLASLAATVNTVATWFGLEIRSSGYLNTTPMAARDLRTAAPPAPA